MKTTQSIRDSVRRLFPDISDESFITWLNLWHELVCSMIPITSRTSSTIAVTSGTASYDVTSLSVSQVDAVVATFGASKRLTVMSYEDVLRSDRSILSAPPGTPDKVALYGSPSGVSTLTLFPAPSANGSMAVYYSSAPTPFTVGGLAAERVPSYIPSLCYVMGVASLAASELMPSRAPSLMSTAMQLLSVAALKSSTTGTEGGLSLPSVRAGAING